ncbi:MAG: hypothetical protein MUC28_02625 [Planctomycetes bacterium]|nr:hypothetical protein [Planctomycetota bacterium]
MTPKNVTAEEVNKAWKKSCIHNGYCSYKQLLCTCRRSRYFNK